MHGTTIQIKKNCCICLLSYWISVYGKLLAFDVCCIMLHYFCFHSSESGSKCKHTIKYLYAAILCSIWWFKKQLLVVPVLVGLHYMSSFIVNSLHIHSRSKKCICLSFSYFGINMILPCMWFHWRWWVLHQSLPST